MIDGKGSKLLLGMPLAFHGFRGKKYPRYPNNTQNKSGISKYDPNKRNSEKYDKIFGNEHRRGTLDVCL